MSASFEKINCGDSFTIEKEISADMIDTFAVFSGDYNPVHMDNTYCLAHGLKSRIAHGMLILSFLSTLIGMHLPGEGAVWLSQSIDFLTPVYVGDTIAITGTVIEKSSSSALSLNLVKMKITVRNQSGQIVARGTAKVSVK